MKRRKVLALLAGAAVSPPLPATAAGEPKVFRLGLILPSRSLPGPGAFEDRLRELGYKEGQNLSVSSLQLIDSENRPVSEMAAELVGRGVDAILASGPEVAVKSAIAATRTVPVVMVAIDYDPLALGYAASLARPGGNVTGVFLEQIELTPKRLDLLIQTIPELVRVVALWDRFSANQFTAAREAARTLKIALDGIECIDPPYDYKRALADVDGRNGVAVLAMSSPLFFADRQRLTAAVVRRSLPAIFAFREWVDEGGLMSYGASVTGMYQLAADYVDRIAKGAKPADLPVQQPTKFELIINLKTAEALGVTIPQSILARADEVIE